MEKKKLLLVTISVGIFLVIAIGAAILVFAPKGLLPPARTAENQTDNTEIPASSTPSSFSAADSGTVNSGNSRISPVDAVELVRNPQEVPGLKPPPEGTARQGSNFYVQGNGSGRNDTVISVPKPSTAAVPDAPPAGKIVSVVPAPAPKSTPAAAPKAVAQAAPKPAAQAAPKPVAATAATASKPAATTKVYDDFWVQTGAFSTVTKAEGVKETLSSKGITSIIENGNVNGQTLFRVRVGPYTSKNEADYWLSLIRAIGGFEDSQVRQTQSRR